uniref:Ankyrin repeat protein n=1 Tax=Panagrolaimus davidi TaxID=227884 RepID=A0A914NZU5_9BILA
MNISQDVNNDEIKRNIEYSVRQQSISIYQDVIEELESITADKIIKKQVQKNLKSSDQAKQNLRQFTLKDLPETNADLYIGLLYEHDCFEIVYKAILTIKEPSEKDNMNGLIIIQTIILLGEAVKFAHGIRTDLNSDYSIIGTLIKLRNNFSGYVSWADLHNISNWNQIIDELNIIKKKIRARLCSLEKCFAENDPEKLKENVKNLLDQGLTFLYTPPEGLIIRMWLDKKQKKENRKKWQEHNDYPQLRDLLVNIENIKKQSNIPSIDNVITIVDELKKICNQIFQPPTFCHTLIVQKLNQDDKNNNLCAFLQLSYTINKLFQNLKTYIEHEQKDENWLNEIRKLEDYKLFELIYGLLRDGRHSTIHHMWRKDYENLASLICIISSNLKPILLALKSKTSGSADVNDMDLEMWWYLLWIKYELIIQHRGSSREMKYTSPWIGFHVIRAEEDKTGFLENLTIEEYANLLHTLHKVIKELLAIYLNADDYNSKLEKFKNTCQNYRLKRDMFFFWPNNICELSQHIESIFEEAIIGFRLTGLEHNIDDIIKNFETLVEQQKDEIHFNRYGLSDRTPLMFSMGLFSDNMIENEQASPIIKKLVTMLITNGADPDKYNSLTLHPMHYAALVGVEFKNYFEEYCNLKCPPDGVFGINSQQFYENFRVFNFRPDGDEKSTPNSFYNPVAMADALQKSMSPSHDSSFLYLYNNYGQTPLTRAVEAGNKVAVEALANASTEIDQKVIKEFKNGETVFSDTALLKAIKLKPIMVNETTMRDKEYIIKVLLKNGADSKISDVNGKSSFDYATHQRNLAKYEKENWFLLPDRSQIDHKILGIQLEYAEKIYKCIAYAEWSNLFSKYDF